MAAIAMFILLIFIAIAGLVYFTIQDKRNAKRQA